MKLTKQFKIAALLAIQFLTVTLLYAQTNTPSADSVTVTDATQAFTALLHFSGVSATGIAVILLLLKTGAQYWRNFALKDVLAADAGPLSRAVAHIAGDSLPEQPPTVLKVVSNPPAESAPNLPPK